MATSLLTNQLVKQSLDIHVVGYVYSKVTEVVLDCEVCSGFSNKESNYSKLALLT